MLGLELFTGVWDCWPSLPLSDGITPQVRARLADVIGDSLQQNETQVESLALPSLSELHRGEIDQCHTVAILLSLTMSGAWRDHLQFFNLASCAGIMSREGDRRLVLGAVSRVAGIVVDSAEARDESAMLMKAVDRLKGLHSYGAVQLMLLHIWSSYSFEKETWKWLKIETLEVFYTHGTEYLETFAIHIKEGFGLRTAVATATFKFRGADGVQRHVRVKDWGSVSEMSGWEGVPSLWAMCIVRV